MIASPLRIVRTAAVAVLCTLLAGSTALAVGAVAASAASSPAGTLTAPAATPAGTLTAPPWEPDPDSVGGLVFYNAAGKVITGGSINDSPIAAYVQGTKTIRAGDKKATLFGYLPVKGQATGQWSGEALGASTTYPNTKAPAPLNGSALPVETGANGDESIATLELDFPNTDTSNDGYAGMYQLRLRTSGPDEGLTITYDSADIHISGDTWSVVYSQVATATALSVAPASAFYGTTFKLTATVTPSSAAGAVQFRDGSKILKTVSVSSGMASYSTNALTVGVHKLSATFVPTNAGLYAESTSSTHAVKISAHLTTTSLKASKASITKGKRLILTAKESPPAAGSVTFFDGPKKLASVKVSKGQASYASTKFAVGTHLFKAKFTPSKAAAYKASTSKVLRVKVVK
jgi:hypothetical protein